MKCIGEYTEADLRALMGQLPYMNQGEIAFLNMRMSAYNATNFRDLESRLAELEQTTNVDRRALSRLRNDHNRMGQQMAVQREMVLRN